jgi:membrane associated rhomboid family serine protease
MTQDGVEPQVGAQPETRERFALRPALFFPALGQGAALLGGAAGCAGGLWLLEPPHPALLAALYLAGVLCAVGGLGLLAASRRRPAWVEVSADAISVSWPLPGRDDVRFPLDALTTFERRTQQRRELLALDARGRPGVLLALRLFEPGAASRFEARVRERLAARGGGADLLAQLDRRARLERTLRARRPWLTYGVCGLLAAVLSIEASLGALDDLALLLLLGASSPWLVTHGEPFRLASAPLLHVSALHCAANVLVLLGLGPALERALGATRLAAVLLAALLGGAVLSAAVHAPHTLSLGASGAALGLLGAAAALQLGRGPAPSSLRLSLSDVASWVAGLAFTLLVPRVDHAAHAGGFAAGALAAALLAGRQPIETLVRARPGRTAVLLVAAASLGFGGAVCAAIVAAQRALQAPRHQAFARWLEDPSAPANLVNAAAYAAALDPSAPRTHLLRARDSLTRALEQLEHADYEDTLALVLFRLGDLDLAVALERRLFEESGGRVFAEPLAHFESARAARSGALRIGGAAAAAPRLRLEPDAAPGHWRLSAEVGEPTPGGVVSHALLRSGDVLLGLVELRFGPGETRAGPVGLGPLAAQSAPEAQVTLIDASWAATSRGGPAVRFVPLRGRVASAR